MRLISLVVVSFFLASCQTMSDEQRSSFQCNEWNKGTKNIDQIRATYTIATGKDLIIRSGGPRTGVSYIDGDIEALKNEIDLACQSTAAHFLRQ
ncbi:MAG: hypothetical protein CMN95_08540 [Synechococcus sp. MED650]|nr:hypothetical protein [Synechococcus sp. MED650]OUW53459.1 MAG: hypothetical protein CBD48_06445 [Cyanobacteria bacterium TMED188]